MMRLPLFEFRAPHTLEEAARILDGEGAKAVPLAGGTDLLPNMKRRQQVPKTLMSLRHIEELNRVQMDTSAFRLGACVTLADIAADNLMPFAHQVQGGAKTDGAKPDHCYLHGVYLP